ncbi:AbrB/MazE/SpoVT family DNA-binding domain-containing protein [Paracoccus sp. MC1854]|uniref:AbrB/MazE/SpoVT family DNA-binding domain-containing protein n=1 Tax=Paracoccus sp. MC1854 TaxID=2760306 RepID=UPI0015FF5BF6|nr:AbrB/MazE/SpoVT family DNA-binding domain-containing protein [Paracoccus sp. MC1854]MBB1492475.1 AbrB/MazE/SpoVT family DNA-binding domain-containing protein [Paracoccus sp. MC1854]
MRITIKGQVTIPQPIREAAGFHPGTEVDFLLGDDGLVRVIPSDRLREDRGQAVRQAIARLRGSADAGMTTDEIMALTRG